MSGCGNICQVPFVKYEQQLQPTAPCSLMVGHEIYFDNNENKRLTRNYPPLCTELVDTTTWLRRYGLRATKLTYQNILSMIGFKQMQNYEDPLRKQVTSKYGQRLFLKTQTSDGTVYNVTADAPRLADYEVRLEEAIQMYQQRLRWLNSGSRRLFGVIQENNVCLVLDCKQLNLNQFSQFTHSVLNLICEQISRLHTFNIIRCGCDQSFESFKSCLINVTPDTISEALEWLNSSCCCHSDKVIDCPQCIRNGKYSDTSTCEGVLKAFEDANTEAIYLISEGTSSNGLREILYDKLVKESFQKRTKLNIISYNCTDLTTIEYLRRVAFSSFGPGRFHAYCLLKKLDDFAPGPICAEPTKNNVTVNKLGFGGAPPGSGIKEDIMALFEEIQEAKEGLSNLRMVIKSMRDLRAAQQAGSLTTTSSSLLPARRSANASRNDDYITSKQWLSLHGLSARKLDLFETLRSVCFKHCDGVVDVKQEPVTGKIAFFGDGKQYYQGDAIPREKLVNARYCDQFAHVLWHDGTIVHVHVTPDLHRNYEKRIKIALDLYEKRLEWLSRGSRALFGTVVENNICFLIDTSQSMQSSLEFVKQKLNVLITEQLKSKTRFNLVSFNSRVSPWRDRMIEVDDYSLQSALDWIYSLNAQGSTNTLGAIRFALNDLNTEAIYLLSDGRPDQEPRQILSQVSLNSKIPIHTISFNCNDREANGFLSELAHETMGRYHYFNETGSDPTPDGALPYESEDTSLLKQEIRRGNQFLVQIAHLREECLRLAIPGTKTNFEIKSRSDIIKSHDYKYSAIQEETKNDNMHTTLHAIQSLDWVLPETRMLLEKQFRSELMQSKKNSQYHVSCTHTEVKKPKPFKANKKYKPKRDTSPVKDKFDSFRLDMDSMKSARSESPKSVKKELIEKIMSKTKDEKALLRGSRVIARNDILGYYYPGKVHKVIDARAVDVLFDDNFRQNEMSCRHVLKLIDSKGYFTVGDYVMACVYNEYDDSCWVPGIIQSKLLQLDRRSKNLYTVLYFNGQEGDNSMSEIIRIDKHIYGETVSYIRSKLGMNTNLKEEGDLIIKTPVKSKSPSPPPPAPDLAELKTEIVHEIKEYFGSLQLDSKYQEMFDEFVKLRRNHKKLKENLSEQIVVIRKEFEDWQHEEPKFIKIEVPAEKVRKQKRPKVTKILSSVSTSPMPQTTVITTASSPMPQKVTKSSESFVEVSLNEMLIALRQSLSRLKVGEEILAKWPDDGWYYRSVITEYLGDARYRIEDSINDSEVLYREDIISEKNDVIESIEVGDAVIALHPHYEESYAPGEVVQVANDMEKMMVRFYDYEEAIVLRRNAYKLNKMKFELDVTMINQLEKKQVGKTVVARNMFSNVYELGKIVDRLGNIGRKYLIEWSSGKRSQTNSNHIFGTDTRKPEIIVNDYILAPKQTIYLPGRVLDKRGDQLKVKFVDGEVDESIYYNDCYWLSRDYYEDACNFYRRELDMDEFHNSTF